MSIIPVERQEWEQLTQDVDQLIRNYEKLLGKMRSLEEEKRQLEKRLAASDAERRELRQRQKSSSGEEGLAISSNEMLTLKQLRSIVDRVLTDSESVRIG